MADPGRQELSIKDYAAVLLRRKWIVIGMVVLVPLCAAVLSMREHPVYQATSTVALREGDLAHTTVQQRISPTTPTTPTRTASPRRRSRSPRPRPLRPRSSSGPRSPVGMPTRFSARRRSPRTRTPTFSTSPSRTAIRRVRRCSRDAYAKQYIVLRSQQDTQTLLQARSDIMKRVNELNKQGRKSYASSLFAKAEQLRDARRAERAERRGRADQLARSGADLAAWSQARRLWSASSSESCSESDSHFSATRSTPASEFGRGRRAPHTGWRGAVCSPASPSLLEEASARLDKARDHREALERRGRGVPDAADEHRLRDDRDRDTRSILVT